MKFVLRELGKQVASESDVTIVIGKEDTFVYKSLLRFSQQEAFIGFKGR